MSGQRERTQRQEASISTCGCRGIKADAPTTALAAAYQHVAAAALFDSRAMHMHVD
jgi:hypothetical protein